MGSEGRGEQTFRTDQDNGLILSASPSPEDDLQAFRAAVLGGAGELRLSPCPGNVMVAIRCGRRRSTNIAPTFAVGSRMPDEAAHMNVAIFYDAEAVAGDAELLRSSQTGADRGDERRAGAISPISPAPIDAFPTPIGLFNNLVTSKGQGDALDLKKGGIFPIVHGVRSLAIEQRLLETGTGARIARLAEARRADAALRARVDAGAALSDDASPRRCSSPRRRPAAWCSRANSRAWSATCCATRSRSSNDCAKSFAAISTSRCSDDAAALDQTALATGDAQGSRVSLPVRARPARRSGFDRLRDDRASIAQGRHRHRCRDPDSRRADPDQRALRGEAAARGAA